jgi:hypothetical protein
MSQLLTSLEQRLVFETHPESRGLLSARIAAHLARKGRFSDARKQIAELRQTFGDGRSGPVTVWMMLAEALIHLYERLSPDAMDRICRAQALSIAMRYNTMIALSSAWRAHLEFEEGKYPAMCESLALALTHLESDNCDADTRIAMVICNSFSVCGERMASQHWFLRAHNSAVKSGDQPSIEAMLYNRAAFSVTRLRAENCISPVKQEALKSARMEIESSRNFQSLTGAAAFPVHLALWDARLQVLESRYESAICKLRDTSQKSPFAEHNFSQDFVQLEIAFCELQLGREGLALDTLKKIPDLNFGEMDVDEQLVASWISQHFAILLPQAFDLNFHQNKYTKCKEDYETVMFGLSNLLEQHFPIL